MKTLRTAVLGLGRIGWQFHIPGIRKHSGFELTAVVDPLRERLDEARKEFGVPGYPSAQDLFAGERLDLVVIASPTPFHAEQAIAAMEHGLDVFCDKPMAPTLAEADRMIEAAKRTGRKLMMYQPHRITPLTQAVRHIVAKGALGPLFMIKMGLGTYMRRNDWQAFRKFGGGMLNNYGAHDIDATLYAAGSKAKRVSCHLRSIASLGDADDVVKAVIETENGIIVDLDINMAAAFPLPRWTLLGKFGSAIYDDAAKAFKLRYFKEEELKQLDANPKLAATGRNYDNFDKIPWHDELLALSGFAAIEYYDLCYDYFGLDKAPFVPLDQTREVMRVLDACRKDTGGAGQA